MSFYCKCCGCPLERVDEYQQENGTKHGMTCERCMEQADSEEAKDDV